MKNKIILSSLVIGLILIFDQLIKVYVKTHFFLYESVPPDSPFQLHFVENEGMAFGLKWGGSVGKILLSVFRIAAVAGLGYYLYRLIKQKQNNYLILTISLVIAGALGNLIDCAFYGLIFSESTPNAVATMFPPEGGYGYFLMGKVVDMFHCHIFDFPEWLPIVGGGEFFAPIFNLADSAITIAVFFTLIFYKKIFNHNLTNKQNNIETIDNQ